MKKIDHHSHIVIDANDLIVGRFATVAAKKALLGNKVSIINVENALVSGKPAVLLKEFKRRRDMGVPRKGPFFSRSPDRFVRRIIRGMLPYKQPRGRDAFKRILCYTGAPDNFKDVERVKVDANKSKLPNQKYVTIKQVCKFLGGKV